MNKVDKSDILALIHTPAEAAAEYVEYAEQLQGGVGVTWGIPTMDRAIVPLHPGDVMGIIAFPGHGKSTLAAYLAKKTANDIAAGGRNECVVYVTFDQSVEEIEAAMEATEGLTVSDLAWGRVDLEKVRRNSIGRAELPLWLVGEAISRRKAVPRMTFDKVYDALLGIETMYESHPKPRLVVLDHLQAIPLTRAAERVEQVTDSAFRAKELARRLGCPVVACVQAARRVGQYARKIPTAQDCQWSSAIEQVFDKLLGIWRPCLTEEKPTLKVRIRGVERELPITQELLIARLQKQRMEAAGHTFCLYMAPALVRLAEYELEGGQ